MRTSKQNHAKFVAFSISYSPSFLKSVQKFISIFFFFSQTLQSVQNNSYYLLFIPSINAFIQVNLIYNKNDPFFFLILLSLFLFLFIFFIFPPTLEKNNGLHNKQVNKLNNSHKWQTIPNFL